jgi:hypothetical protein
MKDTAGEGTTTPAGDPEKHEDLGRVDLGTDAEGRPRGSSPAHLLTGVESEEPDGPQEPHLQKP